MTEIKILNELQYVERVLFNKLLMAREINSHAYLVLNKLARYYYHVKGKRKVGIIKLLDGHMREYHKNYNVNSWYKSIEKNAREARKYPLICVEHISVTKKEVDYIEGLKEINYRKVLFAALCYAKYHNLVSDKNNNWCNIGERELFKRANVQVNLKTKGDIIHDLVAMKAMSLPKKDDSENICVKIVQDDNDDECLIRIYDLRNLGFQYLAYKGEKYKPCAECGEFFRYAHVDANYCRNCMGYKAVVIKVLTCIDCGGEFEVDASNKRTNRCNECYKNYRNEYQRHFMADKRRKC